jgi:beta-lactamase regulating signal transducer with metallopeptidase domain
MNLHAVTRFAGDGIMNSFLAGMVIALLAWAVTRVVWRHGSGTRFAVWFLGLVAIALLPVVGHFAAGPGNGVSAAPTSALTLPAWFASFLSVAWIAGASLGLLHVAHGLYRLQRLRATCSPIDLPAIEPSLRNLLADAEKHRRVTLCSSDAIRVPAAIGYFRPMVVFPSWALAEIAPAELNAILLHELAHLRRWDDWTNLAQKLVKAVFFFHPAVWYIESRLTLEREIACDDAVLAASFSPRAYAESLVSLAEKSFLRRGIQLAQAAVGHVQQLKLRLAEILRKDRSGDGRESARIGKPAVALMSLAAIVSAFGVCRAPRLVAFSNDAPQMASASTGSRAISSVVDVHLEPANLNYTDRPQSASAAGGKVERVHLRVMRRVATKPRVVLAQRVRANEVADEFAPAPIMTLASFPIELTPAPVLVVFQGEQFGPNGPVFWRVTILHLTPAQQRAIAGGLPKQI